ncbi:MAG: class I SAM-dependent DNA methyltransferase [Albidovulum sp.]
MSEKDDLEGAYALRTPEDSVRYYRDWAARYDRDFARDMAYRSPEAVAERYAALGGKGPILDVGAGTGLVAEALARRGIGPIDGIDISEEMLGVAAAKGVYRQTFRADLTRPLDLPDGTYAGCVSAGTFTEGHVGPAAFAELLRIAAPGALFVVTVHAAVYERGGFAATFTRLAQDIESFATLPIDIYGPGATGDHAADSAWLVSFRRRNA